MDSRLEYVIMELHITKWKVSWNMPLRSHRSQSMHVLYFLPQHIVKYIGSCDHEVHVVMPLSLYSVILNTGGHKVGTITLTLSNIS